MLGLTVLAPATELAVVHSSHDALAAGALSIYPAGDPGFTQSLDGRWAFRYHPALDAGPDAAFYRPDFDVTTWKPIAVPANWELKGFAEPRYDMHLADGTGLYRREFRVPASWRTDRRVYLRFEGVAFGFTAWLNGREIGRSAAGAYNPTTFDITDALQSDPRAENVLAVQVSTKPLGYEFDVNDDWALSGIYRDVTVFALPTAHIQDIAATTTLTRDGDANVTIAVATTQSGGKVRARLLAPDGKVVAAIDLPRRSNGLCEGVARVQEPALWSAETPALYHLRVVMDVGNGAVQSVEQTIGLREISIKNRVLLLNGRPVKLRGVDHHDLDPIDGRAITVPEMRRDLELMKKGNINFVRTSHYQPNKEFLTLCDQMGIYVMDEVAIGKGEKHDNDPAYRSNIMARVDATIGRDKLHPSVLIWSIGNENPVTELLLDAGRHAKAVDPSRPICYPMTPTVFRKNFGTLPAFVDLYDEHYPATAELAELAQKTDRPVVFSEYAHALGLAAGRIQDQWQIMQSTPQFAGGAIWHFMDQGILRTSKIAVDRSKPTPLVWLDPHRCYDTHNNDGTDGIVYSDRTPQPDFWEVRKVYSPVQITAAPLEVVPGETCVTLTVENRFDFRSLAGMKVVWSQQRNGVAGASGKIALEAAAHATQTIRVPVVIPEDATSDVLALTVRCLDEKGDTVTERTLPLNLRGADREAWVAQLPAGTAPTVTERADAFLVSAPWGAATVERSTGVLTLTDRTGRVLVNGVFPHCGRKPTMAEIRSEPKTGRWPMSILTHIEQPAISVAQAGDRVRISVAGRYPRPDKPGESFVGGYSAEISASGAVTVKYDYVPTQAKGELAEAGLSVVVPATMSEFRWIGQGPYPGYPGKDRLDEFGLFHLSRDDLRFQGNRRGTELALLTTGTGEGVALAMPPGDVSVQRQGDDTLLSHNAVISGLGNKGVPPDHLVNAATTAHIAGSFTLVPLDSSWPEQLVRWFGPPGPAHNVFHPFFYSYDQ